MDAQRKKTTVAMLSVLSNTVLIVFKLIVGLLIGSVSVISEAIHSGVDLVAAIIALFAVSKSSIPADEDHPFGHGKVENISGTIEALLIFLAAGWILYEAIHKLIAPRPLDSVSWGIGVMALSSLANLFVSQMLFKVGKETDSVALQADGWHLRTDVYTSAGVMVGLLIIEGGRICLPGVNLVWVDPVAAILVALLILHAAWQLTVQSGRDLLDARLPKDEQEWLCQYLSEMDPKIHSYHDLRTRKAGANRFVNLHLQFEPSRSVEECHRLAHEVSRGIEKHFPGSSVTVHLEPSGDKHDEEPCQEKLGDCPPTIRRS
jgi:cation diffusion facilitator family transporter